MGKVVILKLNNFWKAWKICPLCIILIIISGNVRKCNVRKAEPDWSKDDHSQAELCHPNRLRGGQEDNVPAVPEAGGVSKGEN